MINLIPPIVRTAIIKEYWVRVITIGFFVASIVALAISLFALPVYVRVSLQASEYAVSATEAAQRVSEYDLSAGALVKANVMAQQIFELRENEQFSDVLELLLSLQGSDIVLENFDFGRKDGALTPVMISGDATTRQALASFRDALLAEERVIAADLPISNLAKDRDIQFTISVVLKENE
jgi:hypothetical protein